MPPSNIKISIIYEDEFLLVVDKPPGLVSTPSETEKGETLGDILQTEYGIKLDRGGLVHRLDKDTSGIVLAAKDQATFDSLQAQFASREVKKEYLTLVHGFTPEKGEIEGSIGRNPGNREKFIVTEEGREASTEYIRERELVMTPSVQDEIFESFNKIQRRKLDRGNYGDFSLLRVFPKTGRTHQIRVHLKHLNFPIVGDSKYGGRRTERLDNRWCTRQFLHAAKITFTHPKSGERVSFESPLPQDLRKALDILQEH